MAGFDRVGMMLVMRTTLDIDPAVLEAARSLARARGVSIGRVLSDLARSALAPPTDRHDLINGFPVIRIPAGTPPLTDAMVAEAMEDW